MSGEPGMVTQIMKAETTTITGAIQKMAFSAEEGMMSSLRISFSASAKGCIRPMGPVRVGPRRRCKRPNPLRSSQTKDNTTTDRKVNMTTSPTTIQTISRRAMASSGIPPLTGPPLPKQCPGSRESRRHPPPRRLSSGASGLRGCRMREAAPLAGRACPFRR